MCILVSSLNKIITGNTKIYHTNKYLSFNVKTNNEIPVVLLMKMKKMLFCICKYIFH
jgi:hypothetical protein